ISFFKSFNSVQMGCISGWRRYVCMCVMALAVTTTYAGERGIEASKASVSANQRNASSSFSWTKERKLTWADFRGPVGREFGEGAAAATYCGFGFEAGTEDGTTRVEVYNMFQPD